MIKAKRAFLVGLCLLSFSLRFFYIYFVFSYSYHGNLDIDQSDDRLKPFLGSYRPSREIVYNDREFIHVV